jgi:hypothetical protein
MTPSFGALMCTWVVSWSLQRRHITLIFWMQNTSIQHESRYWTRVRGQRRKPASQSSRGCGLWIVIVNCSMTTATPTPTAPRFDTDTDTTTSRNVTSRHVTSCNIMRLGDRNSDSRESVAIDVNGHLAPLEMQKCRNAEMQKCRNACFGACMLVLLCFVIVLSITCAHASSSSATPCEMIFENALFTMHYALCTMHDMSARIIDVHKILFLHEISDLSETNLTFHMLHDYFRSNAGYRIRKTIIINIWLPNKVNSQK